MMVMSGVLLVELSRDGVRYARHLLTVGALVRLFVLVTLHTSFLVVGRTGGSGWRLAVFLPVQGTPITEHTEEK